MDEHSHEEMLQRIAELEELTQQLGQQLDSLSEHVEHRFQRHHSLVESVDEDARRRDRDLEYQIDQVRTDVSAVERSVEQSARGW
jgi:hypothetical protein